MAQNQEGLPHMMSRFEHILGTGGAGLSDTMVLGTPMMAQDRDGPSSTTAPGWSDIEEYSWPTNCPKAHKSLE
jgi:hypothetical protein